MKGALVVVSPIVGALIGVLSGKLLWRLVGQFATCCGTPESSGHAGVIRRCLAWKPPPRGEPIQRLFTANPLDRKWGLSFRDYIRVALLDSRSLACKAGLSRIISDSMGRDFS